MPLRTTVKTLIRTYIYWIGVNFGLATIPALLLHAFFLTPKDMSLYLLPLTSLILLYIDPPRTWKTQGWQALVARLTSTIVAVLFMFEYRRLSASFFNSSHNNMIKVAIFLSLGWALYALIAGYEFIRKPVEISAFHTPQSHIRLIKTGLTAFTRWIGIFIGVFLIPAVFLAALGTLLAILVLYASIFTGVVLLVIDPIRSWKMTGASRLWVRLAATFIAMAFLIVGDSIDHFSPSEGLWINFSWQAFSLYVLPWLIYAAEAGLMYLYWAHSSSHHQLNT